MVSQLHMLQGRSLLLKHDTHKLKELLAIVFACEHFEAYTYGQDIVNIETDHQPLEAIPQQCTKPQRILLRLQNYNLKVKYKKGKGFWQTLSVGHF